MSLPAWTTPLPDAQAMRDTDRWAIEQQGIPSLELMERAGTGLARAVGELAPEGDVAIVCGTGNNGGDGLVAARLLRAEGRAVRVLLTADPLALSGDPAANLERLPTPATTPAHQPFSAAALAGAAVIVDALLGTGFSGAPRAPALEAIEAIVRCGAPVVAADVPSGVDASTGEVTGAAVRAALTVTFAAAKPGLLVAPGKRHAGDVRVLDIGIPGGAPVDVAAGRIEAAVLDEIPRRGPEGTKFASGHVVVCGGSPGLTGAPCLTALAAARAGAGYVTVCVPETLQAIVESKLLEVMTAALPESDPGTRAGVVLEKAARGALAVGPGLGRSPSAQELARELARRADVPLVLDADGLNAHAGRLEQLRGRSAPTVLTPHEGELARLLEVEPDAVGARRLHHAREAARRSGALVVLKGDDTIVADPAGRAAVNALAAPALATAGTGDVLCGVLAALLAKRMDAFTAACAAVYLHARAGRLAAERAGSPEGVIASDVVACLPAAGG